ncbi:hypothetical protein [Streptomyces sp. cg36]|uniref:hypothetical protein n=1 Tax=Streptomyces sp. cg36 TaxID=3238798 RepID=UPI0034E1FBEC
MLEAHRERDKDTTMGAADFITTATAKDATAAFHQAQDTARYEYGHGGYTGTIAEKHDLRLATYKVLDSEEAAEQLAQKFLDDNHPYYADKWGPAGAIEFKTDNKDGERSFVLFGWASC